MKKTGLNIWWVFLIILLCPAGSHAAYCDCQEGCGRPAYIPPGVQLFDEDPDISEEEETLVRFESPNPYLNVPGLSSGFTDTDNSRYMTDVIEVLVERADGYADRDGVWNDSDPYVRLWYAPGDVGWQFAGASEIVSGCNGEACDSVFGYTERIPVPRDGLYNIDLELWDDDGGSGDELLGKKSFSQVPIAGLALNWHLLDDHQDWQCWMKFRIRYEDNGIDNPAWITYPGSGPTSTALFSWETPLDRSGIHHTDIHFSVDDVFDENDEGVFTLWGDTSEFQLMLSHGLSSGQYHVAIRTVDNAGYPSDYMPAGDLVQWIEPTAVPPSPTPTTTPNPSTPTPAPGAFSVGDLRIYSDYLDDLGGGMYRARGNIRINDYVRIDGASAALMCYTQGTPWITGSGTVVMEPLDLPVFLGDFEIDPVNGHAEYGIIQPGQFTSLLMEIIGFYFQGQPAELIVNVVDGWVYCQTLMEIDIPDVGLHVTHAEFVLNWHGDVSGIINGFMFQIGGISISFDEAYFNNDGIHVDHFLLTLPDDLGGGSAEAWGLHMTRQRIWLSSAHIVLPVIRIEGGFEITGFNPNAGPEAWIEHLTLPYTGYKWCVDGRIRIPNLGDSSSCAIETTFSIYGDRLQQACLTFEGGGALQIPIGSTGLFLYKLGGCVTFDNLPYPDPTNQCALGTIYDCNEDVITCCNFEYPDSITVKLLAGLQGGPDILGMKAVHADPLWLDINTGWGVGGGGIIRVLNNYEIGAGRVCVSPEGVRVNGNISIAIIQGTMYLMVTPVHAEGAVEGSVTIPAGDYWLFHLDQPVNLGHFLLMLGYFHVPESDFWGEGVWSTCNDSYCSGLKYGVLYSHEIFGQILSMAVDQNKQFYAWIDLNLFGAMVCHGDGSLEIIGEGIQSASVERGGNYTTVPVDVPENMERSLFTLRHHGGNPSLYLLAPDGTVYEPSAVDNVNSFYNDRDNWKFYSIKYPLPGTWQIILDGMTGVESYTVQLLRGNQPPEVEIEHVEIEGHRARIDWKGKDPDDTAQVSLYYDTDAQHADGNLITREQGSFSQTSRITHWDLSGIPSGWYYLYAKIEDGKNAPVINYYQDPIQIKDTIPPVAPSRVYSNPGNGKVHLWWSPSADPDLHGYEVRWSYLDDDTVHSIWTMTNDLVISSLENGLPYRFVVVAQDLSGNWSAQSEEIIIIPDPAGDFQAPDAIQSLQAVVERDETISLNWLEPDAGDIDHYLIYYGTLPGMFGGTEADQGISPLTVPAPANAMSLSGLTRGARYWFNLCAVDVNGNRSELGEEAAALLIQDTDNDADGLPDDWEVYYWGSIRPSSGGDWDADGVSNQEEFALQTSPVLPDSDGDRVRDNIDPEPSRALDQDFDGISDDWEFYYQADDAMGDLDADGLTNLQEYKLNCNPLNSDTDHDGFSDWSEFNYGSDPANPDDPNPRCDSIGIELEMPSHHFTPGELCYLRARLCNSFHLPVPQANLFVILEVYGQYFFAPSWTGNLDYWEMGVEPGPLSLEIFPEFSWPVGAGSGSGAVFYGAFTDPAIQRIIGSFGMWEMSWSE